MLGQRGMLSTAADVYRDVEPFTALDGVRRDDLRRVLGIVARMDALKFRRELLRLLTGGVDPRNTRAEKKEKHRESDASLNSNGVYHLCTSDSWIRAPVETGEPAPEARVDCTVSRGSCWRRPQTVFPDRRSARTR